jgi:hypothetical protein
MTRVQWIRTVERNLATKSGVLALSAVSKAWVLVLTTAIATLALRELTTSSSPSASPLPPTPAARTRDVEDLRQSVAQLRAEIDRVPVAREMTAAPVLDPIDPQLRSDTIARAHTRISSAIGRGEWTPADSTAVFGSMGSLSDEDRRAVVFEVHQAITSGRVRLAPMSETRGDVR